MIKSKCRYDLSEDCRHYKDCLPCMLDKIKTEVEKLPISDTAVRLVCEVIDKYKPESEE